MSVKPVDIEFLSGHTPGPYAVFVGNANGQGLIRIETDAAAPIAGIHIASMPRGTKSEKDATLIAAAPDLLAEVIALRAGLAAKDAALSALAERIRSAPEAVYAPDDAWLQSYADWKDRIGKFLSRATP